MPTYSISVLKHQQRVDGKFPVSIRLTHNRKSVYLKTDFYVVKQQLNKSYELKDIVVLKNVLALIDKYETTLNEDIGCEMSDYSASKLKEYIENKKKQSVEINFISFARDRIDELKNNGKHGRAAHVNTSINVLQDFNGCNVLNVNNINSSFLRDFEKYLRSERTIVRKNQFDKDVVTKKAAVTSTGVNMYMSDIRAIFNLICERYNNEDEGDIIVKHNPFKKYSIPKESVSRKRNITIECVNRIMNFDLADGRKELGRDVFILSFLLVGINTVDLFEMEYSCVQKDRLVYKRSKTKDRREDSAIISIKIEKEAKCLFDKYADPDKIKVFNFYKSYSNTHVFNAAANKGLKQVASIMNEGIKRKMSELCDNDNKEYLESLIIDESISTYFARHSWATIARNVLNISTDDISLCLNHVNEAHRVTDIYIEKDFTKIDRANRMMIDLLITGNSEL